MNFVVPLVKKLKSYTSAREQSFGENLLYLDANERTDGLYAAYPDPLQRNARTAFAQFRGVEMEQVMLGNGSDECLEWLFKLCVAPGDVVAIPSPTYGMYTTLASAYGAEVAYTEINLDGSLDRSELTSVLPEAKLTLLCSPNNPTGSLLPDEDLCWVLERTSGLVLLDEAYIDFTEAPSKATWITNYPNLVITQTFSKAFGMAGMRVGALIASTEVIEWVTRIKMPYNLSTPAQSAVLEALEDSSSMELYVEMIRKKRTVLLQRLEELPGIDKVYPSEANFIYFTTENADSLAQYLRQEGVLIRQFSQLPGALRWTLSTPRHNQLVFELIKAFSYATRTVY